MRRSGVQALMANRTQAPDGWRVARLGEVLKLEYGSSLPERQRIPGRVPVLGSAGIVGFHNQAEVAGPGIVVGRKGSIGTVTWISDDFSPIDTTYYVVPVNGLIDLRWAYYLLAREDLAKLNRATGVPGLNRDDVYALRRKIPPLAEQRGIAAVLDAIEEAIERTEAVIAATERLRDALLHELLTRGVPGWHTEWREVPGLGTIPADWQVVRLGEVTDVLDARRIPLNADERAKIPGRYPYYGANGVMDHIGRWIFDEDDDLILLAEDGGHFDEFRTRPIAYRVRGKCWVNNHAHVLKAKNREIGSFIFHSLVNKDIRPFINGSTRSKLTQADLVRIKVGLPSASDEALVIAEVLDAVGEMIDQRRSQRDALTVAKTSAADALLTGRVRVPIPVEAKIG